MATVARIFTWRGRGAESEIPNLLEEDSWKVKGCDAVRRDVREEGRAIWRGVIDQRESRDEPRDEKTDGDGEETESEIETATETKEEIKRETREGAENTNNIVTSRREK